MKYNVLIKKKIAKRLWRLPLWVQKKAALLVRDLEEKGPEQPKWQNYSKLSENRISLPLGNVLGRLLAASEKHINDRGVLCWQS